METNQSFSNVIMSFEPLEVICTAGEKNYDLYYIQSGKLLICVNKNTQIIPLAYLEAGQYLGEFSFFDHMPRSAHVVAVKESKVIRIPSTELKEQFPKWLISLAQKFTAKIRLSDEIIQDNGIRRKNVKTLKPLSIEEQRTYYQAISDYDEQNQS